MKLLVVLIFVICAKSQEPDYYWRDYYGVAPEDALSVGTDLSGSKVYVGQVYIHKYGLYIAPITNGTRMVEVPCYGVETTEDAIKILCTKSKEKFSWLSTSYESLHIDSLNRHLVNGGFNGKKKTKLNVGRIMYQGIPKIGLVKGYKVDNANFYFVHKNKMEKAKTYEVLIYNKDQNKTNLELDLRSPVLTK